MSRGDQVSRTDGEEVRGPAGVETGANENGKHLLSVGLADPGRSSRRGWRRAPRHRPTSALTEYARLRDRHWPDPASPAFFVCSTGERLKQWVVHKTFPQLIRQVGLEGCGQRARPRPHDFRHSYAVATLLDWYRDGENVDAKLPQLSSILGHAKPEHTYWYLQSVPELLELVAARLDGLLGAQS